MRKMITETPFAIWIICGALLLYISAMWLRAPYLPKLWVYPTARVLTKVNVLSKMDGLTSQESEHFIIKYKSEDQATVQMIIDAAEEAYGPVTASLGFAPRGKSTILIVSSRQEMQKNFGWSAEQSAMGVFWSGFIEVLSPKAWIHSDDPAAQKERFIKTGPVAHEFTHLVLDAAARGNYPRWFTEGVAQYQEYRLNGYEWITSTNTLDQPLYSLEEMERDFDGVSNQSLAYRESFAAVRFIYETYDEETVRAIIGELNKGKTMRSAIKNVLKMDYATFEQTWQQWARDHMPHPQHKKYENGELTH